MAKKEDPIPPIVQRLRTRLAERRVLGANHYPVPLDRLLDEALAPEEAALLEKILRSRPFKEAIIRGHAGKLSAPVALAEDAERLATSDALLEFARCHTLGDSPWLITDVAKQVPAALRKRFTSYFKPRAARGELPGIAATSDDRVASQLARAAQQHFQSADARPTTLADLAQTAGYHPTREQAKIKKAAARPAFADQFYMVRDKALDAPLLPRDAVERLVAAPETLRYLLRAARTATKSLLLASDIAKKAAAPLRSRIEHAIQRTLDEQRLPEGLVAVRDGRKIKLCLIDDIEPPVLRRRLQGATAHSAAPSPAPGSVPDRTSELTAARTNNAPQSRAEPSATPSPAATATSANGFADAFDRAFGRLDQANGNYNQVSLYELRRALSEWTRETFDAELLKLRREGRYSLSGLQNRFGISPEEQAAGVEEGGHLLIYVSRKG